MSKTVSLLLAALFLVGAPVASAAEISLLAGYRFGGPAIEGAPFVLCVVAPCVDPPRIEGRDGEAFGLVVDLPLPKEGWQFEIVLNHQSGEFEVEGLAFILSLVDPDISVFPFELSDSFDLTTLHFGVLRQWDRAKISPFAAVGVGVAELDAEAPFLFFPEIDDTRLSVSLAGGLKIPLNRWLGVRVEGRGTWTDLPAFFAEDLLLFEVNTGLTFKL